MIRIGAFLVGLFFAGWLVVSAVMGAFAFVSEPPAKTAEKVFHQYPKDVDFSFNGPLGKYDRAQLQRGLQVFREVCAASPAFTMSRSAISRSLAIAKVR